METATKETQVTLIAVGDIMLGDQPIFIGQGVGSTIKREEINYPFLQVASAYGVDTPKFKQGKTDETLRKA